jgi:acyl carrier protein
MSDTALTDLVKSCLLSVAPDLEGKPINPDTPFREQFEIDSMDFLNFIIALHKATGVDLPEKDYPRLETLSGCLLYLRENGVTI